MQVVEIKTIKWKMNFKILKLILMQETTNNSVLKDLTAQNNIVTKNCIILNVLEVKNAK